MAVHAISRRGPDELSTSRTMRPDYDYQDLPPLAQMRDAVVRHRVSNGVSYLLPADKTRNSVDNIYRTDLRVLFQEPYLSEESKPFQEQRVTDSAKHHLTPNTSVRFFTFTKHSNIHGYRLNAESDKVRRSYTSSAPPRGLTGKYNTAEDIKIRSQLHLPVHAKIPEECLRLKREADKIINSVYDRSRGREAEDRSPHVDEGPHPHEDSVPGSRVPRASLTAPAHNQTGLPSNKRTSQSAPAPIATRLSNISSTDTLHSDLLHHHTPKPFKPTSDFETFTDLQNYKLPEWPPMPDQMKTPYLSDEKTQRVWEWLNHNDRFTDLGFLLHMCE